MSTSRPIRSPERAAAWEERLQWPMVIAALLVIPLLVIEESELGQPWQTVGNVLNWGTWLAFLFEFVVMMVVSPSRWSWIKRYPIDVAALVLSPPFLPGGLAGVRVLRLFRVLRLARVFTVKGLLSLEGIRFAAFLAAATVIGGGLAFAVVEPQAAPTAWDGVWWAVTTVTTVGYGDIYPTTAAGRVIGVMVMFVGIGFVALLTAFVAERFVRADVAEVEDQDELILAEIRLVNERLDAIERRMRD